MTLLCIVFGCCIGLGERNSFSVFYIQLKLISVYFLPFDLAGINILAQPGLDTLTPDICQSERDGGRGRHSTVHTGGMRGSGSLKMKAQGIWIADTKFYKSAVTKIMPRKTCCRPPNIRAPEPSKDMRIKNRSV